MKYIKEFLIYESEENKLYWTIGLNEYLKDSINTISIGEKITNTIINFNKNLVGGEFKSNYYNSNIKYLIFESDYHLGIHDLVRIYELQDEYFKVYHKLTTINNSGGAYPVTNLYKCDSIEGVIELLTNLLKRKYFK